MEKILLDKADDIYENFEAFVNGSKKGSFPLPAGAANILLWYNRPSPYSAVTGLTPKDIERTVYFSAWLVTDPKDTGLKKGDVLSDTEYEAAKTEYGYGSFEAGQGAETFDTFLRSIDLDTLYDSLRTEEISHMAELEKTTGWRGTGHLNEKEKKHVRKVRAELEDIRFKIDAVMYLRGNPDTFLIREISLFPLNLRGAAERMSGVTPYGIFHDIESLYEDVFLRAERLRKLIDMNVPYIVLRNEKRILQETVDRLIANGMRGRPKTKGDGIPLFCLSDLLLRDAM